MKLVQLDPALLDDKTFAELRKICYWINKDPNTILYVLKKDEDIKNVAVLKNFGTEISTVKEFDFGTKRGEEGKHYASQCLSMVCKDIENKPDISRIIVQSFNPITEKIVSKQFEDTDGMGTWHKNNPCFDEKYEHLCEQIKEEYYSEESLLDACAYDPYMLQCAKKLLETHKKNRQLKDSENMKNDISLESFIAGIGKNR